MQTRVVLPRAAVVLGLAATVLGYVAAEKSKGTAFDGQQHCVYRRNPALGCGVAAALLLLMGVFLATAAGADGPATNRKRAVADKRFQAAWAAALMATFLFLFGAAMKRGLSRPGWHGRAYNYFCTELRSEIFAAASIVSVVATGFAIAAYNVSFQRTDEQAPGVEMGQPYPPPPVANPAPPQ